MIAILHSKLIKRRGFLEGVLFSLLLSVFLLIAYGYIGIGRKELIAGGVNVLPILIYIGGALIFDRLLLLIHLFRKKTKHEELSCDPKKLSILIISRNGEGVVGETVKEALTIVPKDQIIVISDDSEDRTLRIAKKYGVRVYAEKVNAWKAMCINKHVGKIETPYTLILDDDTRIAGTTIPTNLLDADYSAVCFNITPFQTGQLIFDLQRFEYRRSMLFGKNLRGTIGGVANVSGAIGLFKTKDLQFQATRHSGQWGGEDQQRTALVHLYSEGKGVTYVDEPIRTLVPRTWKKLLKQRSYYWNRAVHESFWLFYEMLFHERVPFILKLDRLYVLFYFLTEPLRIAGWVVAFSFMPLLTLKVGLLALVLSLPWEFIIYLKTEKKDSLKTVFLYPIYAVIKTLARFFAYFMWFYWKYVYLWKKKHHHLLNDRKIIVEYALVVCVIVIMISLAVLKALSISLSLVS